VIGTGLHKIADKLRKQNVAFWIDILDDERVANTPYDLRDSPCRLRRGLGGIEHGPEVGRDSTRFIENINLHCECLVKSR
jgi:hypothetical protein